MGGNPKHEADADGGEKDDGSERRRTSLGLMRGTGGEEDGVLVNTPVAGVDDDCDDATAQLPMPASHLLFPLQIFPWAVTLLLLPLPFPFIDEQLDKFDDEEN